jgi:DNA-formamidopyrimidine glycosylase
MPEGPEVKVLVKELNNKLKNKNLNNINILGGRYKKKDKKFIEALPLKILEIKCKGKFIYFVMEKEWYIFNTLGLTGKWTINDLKHNNLLFSINDTINDMKIYYNDIRNFGTFKFVNDNNILEKKLKTLGNDILEKDFTKEYVLKILNNKKKFNKTIVEILMNQKLFCGLGNYLKSEILYESKISPHRLLKDIGEKEKLLLFKNIKKISNKFYIEGSSYKTSLNNIELINNENFKVYKLKKDINNYNVIRETTKDKRTSFWVNEIQL